MERRKDRRRGFSLIELVIVVLIGSILISIALSSFGNAQARFAVRGARNEFVSLAARARARAIERGETVRLVISADGDSAAVVHGSTVVSSMHTRQEFGNVDMRMATSDITLCMSPRGYADDSCNSFSTAQTLRFVFNADSVMVRILPLGQLIY